ncbi:MAG: hypothetical protein HY072_08940 [Deltaproteobacteria bacterium]|nr:hypothetical protein [Deltaproteobacteria bacterium]
MKTNQISNQSGMSLPQILIGSVVIILGALAVAQYTTDSFRAQKGFQAYIDFNNLMGEAKLLINNTSTCGKIFYETEVDEQNTKITFNLKTPKDIALYYPGLIVNNKRTAFLRPSLVVHGLFTRSVQLLPMQTPEEDTTLPLGISSIPAMIRTEMERGVPSLASEGQLLSPNFTGIGGPLIKNFLISLIVNTANDGVSTVERCGVQTDLQIQYGIKLEYVDKTQVRIKANGLDGTGRIFVSSINNQGQGDLIPIDFIGTVEGKLAPPPDGDLAAGQSVEANVGYDIYLTTDGAGIKRKLYFVTTGTAPPPRIGFTYISEILGFVTYQPRGVKGNGSQAGNISGIAPFDEIGDGEFIYRNGTGDAKVFLTSNYEMNVSRRHSAPLPGKIPNIASEVTIATEKDNLTGSSIDLTKRFCLQMSRQNLHTKLWEFIYRNCLDSSAMVIVSLLDPPGLSYTPERISEALYAGDNTVNTAQPNPATLWVHGYKINFRMGR